MGTNDVPGPGFIRSGDRKNKARASSWAWQRRVKAERRRLEKDPSLAVCWICNEPIDMTLPYQHARAFTLDHLVPIGRGGALDGDTRPAHLSCNAKRGDGRRKKKESKPTTIIGW
ncbi:HNH endonuclease [Corynebacterium phage EmiRose]|uniref:HNH endonuclease n=1 Tax=Corynebacterium phage EmiRose TaxID=2565372 RepID=A0A649VPE2_9CAUD|nr:HNH endonuclease [Corynebacterium phage EmiRose]QGJ94178.1 HNH endonuclease [Corynebacterium phage EmiRose]